MLATNSSRSVISLITIFVSRHNLILSSKKNNITNEKISEIVKYFFLNFVFIYLFI